MQQPSGWKLQRLAAVACHIGDVSRHIRNNPQGCGTQESRIAPLGEGGRELPKGGRKGT